MARAGQQGPLRHAQRPGPRMPATGNTGHLAGGVVEPGEEQLPMGSQAAAGGCGRRPPRGRPSGSRLLAAQMPRMRRNWPGPPALAMGPVFILRVGNTRACDLIRSSTERASGYAPATVPERRPTCSCLTAPRRGGCGNVSASADTSNPQMVKERSHASICSGSKRRREPTFRKGIRRSATRRRTCRTDRFRRAATPSTSRSASWSADALTRPPPCDRRERRRSTPSRPGCGRSGGLRRGCRWRRRWIRSRRRREGS